MEKGNFSQFFQWNGWLSPVSRICRRSKASPLQVRVSAAEGSPEHPDGRATWPRPAAPSGRNARTSAELCLGLLCPQRRITCVFYLEDRFLSNDLNGEPLECL